MVKTLSDKYTEVKKYLQLNEEELTETDVYWLCNLMRGMHQRKLYGIEKYEANQKRLRAKLEEEQRKTEAYRALKDEEKEAYNENRIAELRDNAIDDLDKRGERREF